MAAHGGYSFDLARPGDAPGLAAMSQQLIEAGLRPAWTASRIHWHITDPDSVVLTARAAAPAPGICGVAASAAHGGDDPGPANSSARDAASGPVVGPAAAFASGTRGNPAFASPPLYVAGFAIMRYSQDSAHLNLLAVDPGHRRQGLGRRLIEWLEETAATAGTFLVGLELRASNHSALAFYTKLGYRELGRVAGYYQGVEPAIRMSRDLRVSVSPAPDAGRADS